jgi:hypothetical protein
MSRCDPGRAAALIYFLIIKNIMENILINFSANPEFAHEADGAEILRREQHFSLNIHHLRRTGKADRCVVSDVAGGEYSGGLGLEAVELVDERFGPPLI